MPAVEGARARARAEVTAAIVEEARRQLGQVGAAQLSLRAVARELGMVSSAVYRYVASRDDLLTRLIVDAYDRLGDHVEAAVAATAGQPARKRWVEAAMAARAWAVAHRHEHELLYGTPVPDYEAPEDTTSSGTRATFALLSIVRQAWADGAVDPPAPPDISPALAGDLERLRPQVDLEGVPDAVLVATLAAWTQLWGLVSFELFSQTRGVVDHHEDLFRATADLMAAQIGL